MPWEVSDLVALMQQTMSAQAKRMTQIELQRAALDAEVAQMPDLGLRPLVDRLAALLAPRFPGKEITVQGPTGPVGEVRLHVMGNEGEAEGSLILRSQGDGMLFVPRLVIKVGKRERLGYLPDDLDSVERILRRKMRDG